MRTVTVTAIRFVTCALLILLMAGCSSVKGDYTCEGGLLDSLKLESGDKASASATLLGIKQTHEGTYAVDGSKVTVTLNGQSTVFTQSGKVLDGGEMVGKCTMQ